MPTEIGFSTQAPSLPKGGGTGGLGETFTPDLSSGTGSLVVPFDLPNGPNDIGPRLSLRYDSSAANGPFGLGWGIPLPRSDPLDHGRPAPVRRHRRPGARGVRSAGADRRRAASRGRVG